jgi:phosphoglycolate phosphatase-like HAD superfamily hydrolase
MVLAAMRRANALVETALLVGDTPHDVEAAEQAGIGAIALPCGGYWSDADLAGAVEIPDDPGALLTRLRAAGFSTPAGGANREPI